MFARTLSLVLYINKVRQTYARNVRTNLERPAERATHRSGFAALLSMSIYKDNALNKVKLGK